MSQNARVAIALAMLIATQANLSHAADVGDANNAAISPSVVPDDRYPERRIQFSAGVVGLADLVYSTLPGYRPLRLDLYLPPAKNNGNARPFVVYVHGGGWLNGHTRQSGAFENWPHVLASLAARGYVVASVEYRLSSEAKFPAAEHDVKAAIRWLRTNATQYGIDKQRGLIWGASAGGQLAALTATACGVAALASPTTAVSRGEPPYNGAPTANSTPLESDCVQGAVTWYGIFDFAKLPTQSASAFRNTPDSADARYLDCVLTACSRETLAAASAVTFVDAKDPPMLLIHGADDKTVPLAQSKEMYETLRAAGVRAELLIIPAVDHSFIGATPTVTQSASRQALAKVFAFIDTTIGPGRKVTQPIQLKIRGLAVLGIAMLSCAEGSTAVIAEQDPIRIDSGLVTGKLLTSGGRGYFGIPFAAAPVRDLRWREPQPVAIWRGILNADRKAPECIQNLRAHDINHYFGEEATSEDCLYLNIWTPPISVPLPGAGAATVKRPVIVWIYGGGFTIGSSGMANYDGENLARKGVIVVSFNYRLGAFGFLAHPELTRESIHHASGNYGLLDQVAALQWVRRNIAAFGGDENNVTLMGQSAGSMSVFLLLASPLSRGLIHGVIGMSGGPGLGPAAPTLAESEQFGLSFQRALKAKSIADLRQRPADQLLNAQNQCLSGGCPERVQIRPSIDGYFLPEDALARFEARRAQDVPALLGFTRDESWNELLSATTPGQYREIAIRIYGERADEFLRLYPPGRDVNAATVDAVRDGGMATVMRTWARAQRSAGKAPVYMYVFSHPHPYTHGITFADHDPTTAGAYHASEVPYFFQTLESLNLFRRTRTFTDDDRHLADQISDCIVAFARSGNPVTTVTPWPPYELSNEQLVEFAEQTRVKTFNTARMNFMATAHTPFSLSAPLAQRSRD